MSTNNFKFENILIVTPDFNFYHESESCDCEDKDENGICERQGKYVDFDNWAYEEYKKDIQSQLRNIGFTDCDHSDHERNYPGLIISDWKIEDKEGNLKILEVVIRNGYYDGSNIDYTIHGNYGEFKSNKTLDKKFESKCKAVEKILRKNGKEW